MQSPINDNHPQNNPLSLRWSIPGLIIAWLCPLSWPLAVTAAFSFEVPSLGYGDFIDFLRMPALLQVFIIPYIGFAIALFLCIRGSWKVKLAAAIPLIVNFILSVHTTLWLYRRFMFFYFLEKNL